MLYQNLASDSQLDQLLGQLTTGTHKTPQKHFKTLVDSFNLAIRLWMVSNTDSELYFGQIEQFLPEQASENYVPVKHNRDRQAKQLIYLIPKYLGH